MIVVGVDPGLTGALAELRAEIERVAKRYEDEGMAVMAASLRALRKTP